MHATASLGAAVDPAHRPIDCATMDRSAPQSKAGSINDASFYAPIPSFTTFNEITDDRNYRPLPHSWSVVITDVQGSTLAISQGRYKDVNTIGAASIVVARKVMKGEDFPFVFGGDGATMLIDPEHVDGVIDALGALARLARDRFQLDLRVGRVRMSQIAQAGKSIEVAKFELSHGRSIAMLRGDGVPLAERLIKQHRDQYEARSRNTTDADLTGLSCRWKPIASRRGRILTLVIEARVEPQQTMQLVLDRFAALFPDGIEKLNPAVAEFGQYKSMWACLKDEWRYHSSVFSIGFLKRAIEIIPACLIFNLPIALPQFKQYVNAVGAHSDFRKFDNMLRMVIDCSHEQVQAVKDSLERLHANGKIFFGTHESDSCLMTCFVEGMNPGEHIHFIDAANGGYTAAAAQLKAQIAAASRA